MNVLRNIGRWLKGFAPDRADLRENWRDYAAASASGLLLRLAFPKPDLWFIAWFALVPFLWSLRSASGKAAFYRGWAFGFAFYYSIAFFLNTLVVYVPAVVIGIVLGGLFQGVFAAVFAWGVTATRRFERWSLLLIPVWWVALEWLRSSGEMGFPFGTLAHSQWKVVPCSPMGGLIPVTGVAGVSFLILLSNVIIARLVFRRIRGRAERVAHIAAIVLIGLNVLFGLLETSPTITPWRVGVAVVQPSVPQMDKWNSYSMNQPDALAVWDEMTSKVIALTDDCLDEAQRKPHLIVWPETAVPDFFFNVRPHYVNWVQSKVDEWGVPLLMGASRVVLDESGRRPAEDYVSAHLFEPGQRGPTQHYDKVHLVPFGEDFSYFRHIPFIEAIGVSAGTYDRGDEVTVFNLPWTGFHDRYPNVEENPFPETTTFSTVICFESTMAYLTRRAVRNGAQFLTVITNDGWYGTSSGPAQHQIQSVFRAIETHRYVVRCANNGVSCVVSPEGMVLHATDLNDETAYVGKVVPLDDVTFYVRFGDWFAIGCLLIAVLSAATALWQSRRRPAPQSPQSH